MKSRLVRFEKSKSREGNDEIFVQVKITDDIEVYNRGEWLLQSDVALVSADEKAINTIVAQVVERGVTGRPQARIEEELDRLRNLQNKGSN